MYTETIIPLHTNAFYARFERLEFLLRGKIVVVCGKCTPSDIGRLPRFKNLHHCF